MSFLIPLLVSSVFLSISTANAADPSTYICKTNSTCIVECGVTTVNNTVFNCTGSTINAFAAESLSVTCNATLGSCSRLSVLCPPYFSSSSPSSCDIQCTGNAECEYMKVTTNYANQVSVRCAGAATDTNANSCFEASSVSLTFMFCLCVTHSHTHKRTHILPL